MQNTFVVIASVKLLDTEVRLRLTTRFFKHIKNNYGLFY